jgi:DNA-binding LacI/PurR family transcriptional regulator
MSGRSERKTNPTQVDVARLAGVSRTTVSYVLSGSANVSIPEETRQRIWSAVETLGYTPHAQAQRLRSGKANTITMLFPGMRPVNRLSLNFTGAARRYRRESFLQPDHSAHV